MGNYATRACQLDPVLELFTEKFVRHCCVEVNPCVYCPKSATSRPRYIMIMSWPCGEMASRLTTICNQEIAGSTPVSVNLHEQRSFLAH